jgi:hypothetical protein
LLVSVDDLGKGAAVEAEKFQELRQRGLDFRDDLVEGNVGKTGGKIGKQAFECQEFFERWFGRARRRAFIARNSRFLARDGCTFSLSARPRAKPLAAPSCDELRDR